MGMTEPRLTLTNVADAEAMAAEIMRRHGWVGSVGPREAGLRAALLEAIEALEDLVNTPYYNVDWEDHRETIERLQGVVENP